MSHITNDVGYSINEGIEDMSVGPCPDLIARKLQGCDDMSEITTVLPWGLWRET